MNKRKSPEEIVSQDQSDSQDRDPVFDSIYGEEQNTSQNFKLPNSQSVREKAETLKEKSKSKKLSLKQPKVQ